MKIVTKKRFVTLVAALILMFSISGCTTVGKTYPAGPVNPPTHIMAALGQDETQMLFAWNSNAGAENNIEELSSVVLIAPAASMRGRTFPFAAATEYRAVPVEGSNGKYANRVTVSGLEMDAEYVYMVGNGTRARRNWSSVGSFTTGGGEAFSFLYSSDAQTTNENDGLLFRRNFAMALKKAPHAAFMLHTGDQVDSAGSSQHNFFFAPQAEFLRLPLMTVRGNHDRLDVHRSYFTFPNNGYGEDAASYWFKQGGALFIVLDTEVRTAEKAEWMRAVAAQNAGGYEWLIVVMHRPAYSAGSHWQASELTAGDGSGVRNRFLPVFNELGVDLVLAGHDHSFMRSFIMDGGGAHASNSARGQRQPEIFDTDGYSLNPRGTLHMTVSSIGGLKQYPINDNAITRSYANIMKTGEGQYVVVDVAKDTLVIRTYNTANDSVPFDEYKIKKGVDQSVIDAIATYAVTYDANGGSFAPSEDTKSHNAALRLSTSAIRREGFFFQGWAASAGAVNAEYQPGDIYASNEPLKLYAVWESKDPSKIVYIGVDGAHYNEYVAGRYSGLVSVFGDIVNDTDPHVYVKVLNSETELRSALANPQYKAFFFSVPGRSANNAPLNAPGARIRSYSKETIDAVQAFAERGGHLIITGWGNGNEAANITGLTPPHHNPRMLIDLTFGELMSSQQNQLLAAVGSALRISRDEGQMQFPMGSQTFTGDNLLLTEIMGSFGRSPLINDNFRLEPFRVFRATTLHVVNNADRRNWNSAPGAALPDSVTQLVSFGLPSRSSYRGLAQHNTGDYPVYEIPAYNGRLMVLASEKLTHPGGVTSEVIVGGCAFISNYELGTGLGNDEFVREFVRQLIVGGR